MTVSRAVDGVIAVTTFCLALYCAVQMLRGVPVEPLWGWGVFAYLSAARWAARDFLESRKA